MTTRNRKTLLETLDELPPFAVFALARNGHGKRPTLDALAKRSGMPLRTFVRIARKLSWADVKTWQNDAFCAACGVDLLRKTKHLDYWRHAAKRRRPFSHLSERQRDIFNRQCGEWAARREVTSATPPHPGQCG